MLRRRCLLVFLLLAASPLYAQTYVVGVENHDYYPHYGMNDEDQYHGIAREILDDFATAQGISLKYQPLPVERLFRALVNGEVDFKYPDNPVWSKDLKAAVQIHYSQPVVAYTDGILLPTDHQPLVEELKQIATILGFTMSPFWEDRVAQGLLKRIGVKQYDSLLLMALVGNRVDAIYANVDVGLYRLQQIKSGKSKAPVPKHIQDGKQALVFAADLPHVRGYYHLSSLQHAELIKAFDEYLIQQAEQIKALKRKYQLHAD